MFVYWQYKTQKVCSGIYLQIQEYVVKKDMYINNIVLFLSDSVSCMWLTLYLNTSCYWQRLTCNDRLLLWHADIKQPHISGKLDGKADDNSCTSEVCVTADITIAGFNQVLPVVMSMKQCNICYRGGLVVRLLNSKDKSSYLTFRLSKSGRKKPYIERLTVLFRT